MGWIFWSSEFCKFLQRGKKAVYCKLVENRGIIKLAGIEGGETNPIPRGGRSVGCNQTSAGGTATLSEVRRGDNNRPTICKLSLPCDIPDRTKLSNRFDDMIEHL